MDHQAQRWLAAGCFEAIGHDLRAILRLAREHRAQPSAVIFDSQTGQATPARETRAGSDGAKRTQGTNVPVTVDPVGSLLALHLTPAKEQDRAAGDRLAQAVQAATGQRVGLAYVDQGYQGSTGEQPAAAAAVHGVPLEVVKHPKGTRGLVLLPRRWVVERSFAWTSRFRRLVRDDERLTTTILAGQHVAAFACPALARTAPRLPQVHNRL